MSKFVGIIGGITIAFVGSTFPILIPMIHAMGESRFMLPYIMLAMVCGSAGVLFSPLHPCLILSNAYFHTSLQDVYRYMWFPCVALILSAFIYYCLLHWGLTWVLWSIDCRLRLLEYSIGSHISFHLLPEEKHFSMFSNDSSRRIIPMRTVHQVLDQEFIIVTFRVW